MCFAENVELQPIVSDAMYVRTSRSFTQQYLSTGLTINQFRSTGGKQDSTPTHENDIIENGKQTNHENTSSSLFPQNIDSDTESLREAVIDYYGRRSPVNAVNDFKFGSPPPNLQFSWKQDEDVLQPMSLATALDNFQLDLRRRRGAIDFGRSEDHAARLDDDVDVLRPISLADALENLHPQFGLLERRGAVDYGRPEDRKRLDNHDTVLQSISLAVALDNFQHPQYRFIERRGAVDYGRLEERLENDFEVDYDEEKEDNESSESVKDAPAKV